MRAMMIIAAAWLCACGAGASSSSRPASVTASLQTTPTPTATATPTATPSSTPVSAVDDLTLTWSGGSHPSGSMTGGSITSCYEANGSVYQATLTGTISGQQCTFYLNVQGNIQPNGATQQGQFEGNELGTGPPQSLPGPDVVGVEKSVTLTLSDGVDSAAAVESGVYELDTSITYHLTAHWRCAPSSSAPPP
jgi:hypothetical protein